MDVYVCAYVRESGPTTSRKAALTPHDAAPVHTAQREPPDLRAATWRTAQDYHLTDGQGENQAAAFDCAETAATVHGTSLDGGQMRACSTSGRDVMPASRWSVERYC